MTTTEALLKAIEIAPSVIGIYNAGVIDISGYEKSIHMSDKAFLSVFSEYDTKPHSEDRNELSVNWNGYRVFCLERVKEEDDNGVGTGAA